MRAGRVKKLRRRVCRERNGIVGREILKGRETEMWESQERDLPSVCSCWILCICSDSDGLGSRQPLYRGENVGFSEGLLLNQALPSHLFTTCLRPPSALLWCCLFAFWGFLESLTLLKRLNVFSFLLGGSYILSEVRNEKSLCAFTYLSPQPTIFICLPMSWVLHLKKKKSIVS